MIRNTETPNVTQKSQGRASRDPENNQKSLDETNRKSRARRKRPRRRNNKSESSNAVNEPITTIVKAQITSSSKQMHHSIFDRARNLFNSKKHWKNNQPQRQSFAGVNKICVHNVIAQERRNSVLNIKFEH